MPNNCNKVLKPVPHAPVKAGDHAKVAWLKERGQLDKANGRIATGADCWQMTVDKYAQGAK